MRILAEGRMEEEGKCTSFLNGFTEQFSCLEFVFSFLKEADFFRLPPAGRRIRVERINEAGSIRVLSHR